MTEKINQPETAPSSSDFRAWTRLLASKFGETPTPDRETQISLLLEWMYDPATADKQFNNEKKKEVRDFFQVIMGNSEYKANILLLSKDENLQPGLKKALAELAAHIEGGKNTLIDEPAESPQEGGVPINAAAPKEAGEETTPQAAEGEEEHVPEAPDGAETQPETGTQAQGESGGGDSGGGAPDKAKESLQDLQDFSEKLKHMSWEEKFNQFKEILGRIFKFLGVTQLLGEAAPAAEKFTEDQVKEINLDFGRVDESKTFTSANKDTEYVAQVLNLPVKSDANAFLESLKSTPNCVFSAEKELSKLKSGDVLFFHDGKDKEKAVKTAIVSKEGPRPMMKIVREDGKVHEVTIEQSPLFMNWLGYVRMPLRTGQAAETAGTAETAGAAAAAGTVAAAAAPGTAPAPNTVPAQAGTNASPAAEPTGQPATPVQGSEVSPAQPTAQPPARPATQTAQARGSEAQPGQPQANPQSGQNALRQPDTLSPGALEPYMPGTEKPHFSDTPVMQGRIRKEYAKAPPTYTTDNMPEKFTKNKSEIEKYLTNRDPVTGKELTFLGRPFNVPPEGGVNLMMIPFLKVAEEKIKKANIKYQPVIERYRGYEYRGLKIGGVPSPDILSSHAFGMAFDIDPGDNMPANKRGNIPDEVVMLLVESGFAWGSVPAKGFHFGNADAMHFQLRFDPRDSNGQAIINSSPVGRAYWNKVEPLLRDVEAKKQAAIA